MLVLLLSILSAHATEVDRHASELQPVTFSDTAPVFDVVAFDSGFLPSASDPLSVRFAVTPSGGVTTEVDAYSFLEWTGSDSLEQTLVGIPGTGELTIDGSVDIVAEVNVDIFGIWSGSVDVWSETKAMFAEAEFDELPLPGSSETPTATLTGINWIDPVEYEYNIITGVDLVFGVTVNPQLSSTISGVRVDVDTAEGSGTQADIAEWALLPVPGEPLASMPLTLNYVANLDNELSFVFEPNIRLDTFISDYRLFSYPIDVPLLDDIEERLFPAVDTDHPLPLLEGIPGDIDMGTAEVGGLAVMPLTVLNDGELTLDGIVRIEGSDDVAVFPDTVYIPPGGEDGLTLSFLPVLDGARAVTLVIETNDPVQPQVEIPISAEGLDAESTDPGSTGGDNTAPDAGGGEDASGTGCGCESSSSGPFAALWMLPLVLLRRRTRSESAS